MASASCFYPNGDLVGDDSPCNPDAKVSMCCGPTDICLSNGLCYVANINALHRGSCTDQSWLSTSCVDICVPGNEGGSFSDLSRCTFGADPNGFICSLDPNDCDDSTKVFNITDGFFADFRNSSQSTTSASLKSTATTPLPTSISSSISSSTISLSSIATTHVVSTPLATSLADKNITQTQSHTDSCNRRVAAVGAGIGVPLGLLSCAFLGAFLWTFFQLRKQRITGLFKRTTYPSTSTTPEPGHKDSKYGSKIYLHQQGSYEMNSRRSDIYEVSASPRVF